MHPSAFLRHMYGHLEPDEFGWINFFQANPNSSDAPWYGRFYNHSQFCQSMIDSQHGQNLYWSTAILRARDGEKPQRRKMFAVRPVALVGDDVNPADLMGDPTYSIETSPGKFQVGCKLSPEDPDVHDLALFDKVLVAMAAQGLVPADKSGNNLVRYVRVPFGVNTKPRDGGVWSVRMHTWNPEAEYSLADACAVFGIDLDVVRQSSSPVQSPAAADSGEGSDWRSLIAAFTHPDPAQRNYHDPLNTFAAKLTAAGTNAGATVNVTRALMELTRPTDPAEAARWESRYQDIPRSVQGAQKYLPAIPAPVSINLPGLTQQPDNLFLTAAQLAAACASISWLVKGLIPQDAMGMIFGASGSFKSFVALSLALHVAHGIDWCGRKTKQRTVLYCAAEGGAGIYRRVLALQQQHGWQDTDNFRVCTTPLTLSLKPHLAALVADIDKLPTKPGLVFIDTLSQSSNVDENDATEVADLLRSVNADLRARYNCTVVWVHHTGHSVTERPRGSSVLTANMDFSLSCARPDIQARTCAVETSKQKDGEKAGTILFDLHTQVVGTDEDGEEVTSLAAVHNGAVAKFAEQVRGRWGRHEKALWEALERPRSEADLRQVFVGLCATQEAARKAYTRSLAALTEQGFIERAGETVQRKGATP